VTLLAFLSLSIAKTYYIAPNGNNNDSGTKALPFATIQKAHDIAVAGDTIYMLGGTYTFTSQTNISRSGANGQRICLFAFPGELPVIDAIKQPSGANAIRLMSASWWHIKGLEIKNSAERAISIENASHNNIIENNNVYLGGRLSEWDGKGIVLLGSGSYNLILNNDSHNNRDLLGDGGNADGYQVSSLGVGNVLRGNRAWQNSDDGFDNFNVQNNTSDKSLLIEGNWAFENGYDENLVAVGNGMGFKLGGGRNNTTTVSGGHMVRNNLAWKNLSGGFDDNNSSAPAKQAKPDTLYNNTAWNNPLNYVFWAEAAHVFRNNLNVGTLGHINGSATFNSWTLPVIATDADFVSVNDACARAPRKADGSLPDCSFLHLATGSDLIDKGVDVGITYKGTKPDLGAFETSGSTSIERDEQIIPNLIGASPNPCKTYTIFQVSGLSTDEFELNIYNTYGQMVDMLSSRNLKLNTSNKPTGLYISVIKFAGKIYTHKFNIMR
jgi:hypothetical protein